MNAIYPPGTKIYRVQPDTAVPHTGQMLRNYLRTHRIPISKLARMVNRHSSTIGDYLKRPSIQVHILWEISKALEHNFLEEIANKLPSNDQGKPGPESVELEWLRRENELLKDLLKR